MKINPVHALLEVLKQQARGQATESLKAKQTTVEDALLQQMRGNAAENSSIKSGSKIAQILAESKDTKFRLEMLERLVADKIGVRGVSLGPTDVEERLASSENPALAKLASSGATDALNQTMPQSNGRAWHSQPDLWNNADAEFLKYHVTDPGVKPQGNPVGIAEKFTPTVEDIESALFKEGADPAQFAKMFLSRGDVSFEAPQQGFAPRLVPIVIGVLMLFAVAYLIL